MVVFGVEVMGFGGACGCLLGFTGCAVAVLRDLGILVYGVSYGCFGALGLELWEEIT